MIEYLVNIDRQIFIAIHQGLANPILDFICLVLRKPLTWLPLYLLFAILAIKKHRLQGFYILLATALVVALCDRFSAGFMKPFFERLRPCHEPTLAAYIRNVVSCGGQYGFISSHATNHFGMAVMFTWFFQKITAKSFTKWIFYTWATLICFAQVYVGKHYLGDVLVGAAFGFVIGKLVLFIFTSRDKIKELSKSAHN